MRLMQFSFRKTGVAIFAMLLLASCVQLKKTSLYDGVAVEAPPAKPTDIELVVEPVIYDDDVSDVWGLEKDVCQEASVTSEVAYSGTESLSVTWNRDAKGCKWSGIGIGWDGYAGKDLSEIMDYVAIQMYVRTKTGRAFGLPFVLTLEDYSGGMGFCYTSNKYFERTAIDEEWQRVIVPLNDFEIEKENLDPTNIKQLQIELQQSGSIYLDDIRLVFYEPEPQKPWMIEEELPDPTALPITIFADAFINDNSWGLMSDDCQTIKLTDAESASGKKSVQVKWNEQGGCKLIAFGASWNKWHPVDITAIHSSATLEFDLKVAGNSSEIPRIKVGFGDYDRVKALVPIQAQHLTDSQSKGWKTVKIPFTALPDNFDKTRVKHLYFGLEGQGEVFIDNIRLGKR